MSEINRNGIQNWLMENVEPNFKNIRRIKYSSTKYLLSWAQSIDIIEEVSEDDIVEVSSLPPPIPKQRLADEVKITFPDKDDIFKYVVSDGQGDREVRM